MKYKISSEYVRSKLKPRREPYWHRVSKGLFVGYRKLAVGEGTWIARYRPPFGKQHYKALGEHLGLDDAVLVATVWGAAQKAKAGPARPGSPTVEGVCRTYVARLRVSKGDASGVDAAGRFERLIYGTNFGKMALMDVRPHHLRDWRDGLVQDDPDPEVVRRSKDSANRNLTAVKAAFNAALKDQLIDSDAGWRIVEKFKGVGRRREALLSPPDRKLLLSKCPRDLAILVRSMLLTLSRPGELARANVADLDVVHGTLSVDGKTGRRTMTLSSAALRFLKAQARGKAPEEPLLTDAAGYRWEKEAWKGRIKEAVRAAGLPDDVVLYTMRHVGITELVAGGVDSHLVAKVAGTSTKMIDEHYGHVQHARTRAHLDSVKIVPAGVRG